MGGLGVGGLEVEAQEVVFPSGCDSEVVAVLCAQKWLGDDQVQQNLRRQLSPSLFMNGVDSSSGMSLIQLAKLQQESFSALGFFFSIPQPISFLSAATLLKAQRSALSAVLGGHASTLGLEFS